MTAEKSEDTPTGYVWLDHEVHNLLDEIAEQFRCNADSLTSVAGDERRYALARSAWDQAAAHVSDTAFHRVPIMFVQRECAAAYERNVTSPLPPPVAEATACWAHNGTVDFGDITPKDAPGEEDVFWPSGPLTSTITISGKMTPETYTLLFGEPDVFPVDEITQAWVVLGKRVRKRRKAVGYDRTGMAAQLGMTKKEYRSLEKGERLFTLLLIKDIANILGTSAVSLAPEFYALSEPRDTM